MTKQEMNTYFDTFVANNNGEYISILSPGRECFDLSVAWTRVLGIPNFTGNPSPFPYVYAYQIYTGFSPFQATFFDRIANTLEYVPQKGDIIVWSGGKPGTGGAGHTAVATGVGNTSTFQAFSQNDPTGAKCTLKTYDYNYVLGALRPKVTTVTPTPTPVTPPNIVTKASFFDRLAKVKFGENVNSDKITSAQVDAWIAELKSEKYRSGEWDRLATLTQYTGDTSKLTAVAMKDRIAVPLQDEIRRLLAERPKIRQQVIDECSTHLLKLK